MNITRSAVQFLLNQVRVHPVTVGPLATVVGMALGYGTYQSLRHLMYNPDVVVDKGHPFPWQRLDEIHYQNLYKTYHTH